MGIPVDVAAKVLFLADRTCCVCREKGKPVQIHHIDSNNANHKMQNLAVLCLGCHTETQIQGGFHRKLDADQVMLYRDDWQNIVARQRAADVTSLAGGNGRGDAGLDVQLITSIAESLRENEQYELLAIYYSTWGNDELRDKYIEKTLSEKQGVDADTEIYLRSLQGKVELVKPERIQGAIEARQEWNDLSQLARLYSYLDRPSDAVRAYCKSVVQDLDEGNSFSAAFYLKELAEKELFEPLFRKAYKEMVEKGDLWWQVRCLQELGWQTELRELLISRQHEIEESGNMFLKIELYRALGDREKYLAAQKESAAGTRLVRIDINVEKDEPEKGSRR